MNTNFEPPPKKWSVLAVVGGLIVGIGAIIGLEALSNTFSEQAGDTDSDVTEVATTTPKLDAEDLAILEMDVENAEIPGTPVTSQQLKAVSTPYIPTEKIELTEEDLEVARKAWEYFETNWNEETGLVNSVDDFPSVTMWDQAAGMAGLVSAYELGIVEEGEFKSKMGQALETLAELPLYNNELPNKVYNSETLIPVNYGQLDEEEEIGWSAIDLGRLALWLKIIEAKYPNFAEEVQAVWDSWDVDRLTKDGQMYGTSVTDGEEQYNQEGRLGYEDYAAFGLSLWGLNVEEALDSESKAEFVDLYGVGVPYDERDAETFGANNYVLTEPFILDGIETGFQGLPKAYADRILEAQEARYLATDQLTAVTEDNLDREPYFVYNSLFVNDQPWATITDTGETYNHLSFLSAKASVGLHSLYNTDYTQKLYEFVQENLEAEEGWFNGYYVYLDEPNDVLTANNNGVILESILYKKVGEPLTLWAGVETVNSD